MHPLNALENDVTAFLQTYMYIKFCTVNSVIYVAKKITKFGHFEFNFIYVTQYLHNINVNHNCG